MKTVAASSDPGLTTGDALACTSTASLLSCHAQGPYSVRITAAGKGTDVAQLFCLDVAFDVVPSAPSVQEQ